MGEEKGKRKKDMNIAIRLEHENQTFRQGVRRCVEHKPIDDVQVRIENLSRALSINQSLLYNSDRYKRKKRKDKKVEIQRKHENKAYTTEMHEKHGQIN
ncbi:hypothetical protein ACTXT7_000285 [Hymenolepis weldensis]